LKLRFVSITLIIIIIQQDFHGLTQFLLFPRVKVEIFLIKIIKCIFLMIHHQSLSSISIPEKI
jgi:hypothetical protein